MAFVMKLACLLVLFVLAVVRCQAAPDDKPGQQLSVELRDGSRIVGQTLEDTLNVHSTMLGDMKLSWSGISAIDYTSDDKEARLTAANGDVFTVEVLTDALNLQTQFGKAVLPIKLIATIKVSKLNPALSGVTDATRMRLIIALKDGSSIRGTSLDDTLIFHTGTMGDMKLKWAGVRSMEYSAGGGDGWKLTTKNGDVYQVQFMAPTVRADTGFGTVDLAVRLIRSISVSAQGDAGQHLLGWWKLDDGRGTVAKDSSLSVPPHDGALTNGPVWIQANGQDGGALRFNGGNQYVSLGNVLQEGYKEISIACWVKRASSGPQTLVERGDWNNPDGIDLCVDGSSAEFGHAADRVTSKSSIQDDQWHHVVGTMAPSETGTGYLYSLYVDGKLDNTMISQVGLTPTSGAWFIGGQGSMWNYTGLIKDVRIYDHALLAGEVDTLYAVEPHDEASRPLKPLTASVSHNADIEVVQKSPTN